MKWCTGVRSFVRSFVVAAKTFICRPSLSFPLRSLVGRFFAVANSLSSSSSSSLLLLACGGQHSVVVWLFIYLLVGWFIALLFTNRWGPCVVACAPPPPVWSGPSLRVRTRQRTACVRTYVPIGSNAELTLMRPFLLSKPSLLCAGPRRRE